MKEFRIEYIYADVRIIVDEFDGEYQIQNLLIQICLDCEYTQFTKMKILDSETNQILMVNFRNKKNMEKLN